MFASDNAKGIIVSNGMRWINNIECDTPSGESPEWMKDGAKYYGVEGELKRVDGDQIITAEGFYKAEWGDGLNSNFKGWMQLDSDGKIINEGFLKGEPDFGWASTDPLNWDAKSSFNPQYTNGEAFHQWYRGYQDAGR